MLTDKAAKRALCQMASYGETGVPIPRPATAIPASDRTIDHVLADHQIRSAGHTRYSGQPLRDDEIMVAEIQMLREIVYLYVDPLNIKPEHVHIVTRCVQQ